MSVALPDRYMLAQLCYQPQGGIQLFVFIVGHVRCNHYYEAWRAARVHTSHHPILLISKQNHKLQWDIIL